jgi:hypothetical protein
LELRLQPAQSLQLKPHRGSPHWGSLAPRGLAPRGLRVAASPHGADPMDWDSQSTLCGRGFRLLAPLGRAPMGRADGIGFIGVRGLRVKASPMGAGPIGAGPHGAGDVAVSHAALSSGRYHQLRCATCPPQWGQPRLCRLAKVTVLWLPQESWRLRLAPLGLAPLGLTPLEGGNRVEVNSAYSLQRPYPG